MTGGGGATRVDVAGLVATTRSALAEAADPERAPEMAVYMRHQFAFLGVASAPRRAAQRPNLWLARTAILHQLSHKDQTDAERLFAYADRRAPDTDFFIRKALGWALRQYARTDPEAVRAYVASRGDRLSPLTQREALKRL